MEQLKALRLSYHRGYCPSIEEIRRECEKIQAEWTEDEELSRARNRVQVKKLPVKAI